LARDPFPFFCKLPFAERLVVSGFFLFQPAAAFQLPSALQRLAPAGRFSL
jgi:hypothetical protein